MPQSEASSSWEVLTKTDPTSSRPAGTFPTTSPVSATTPRSPLIKGKGPASTNNMTERLAKVSLDQPLPQGHQVRNVSNGSVESGSSAWGTLASKSILSGSSSGKKDKDKEGRKGMKEKKKDNSLEKKENPGKPKTSRKEQELGHAEMTNRPAQPGSMEVHSAASVSQLGVASSGASIVDVDVNADASAKKKKSRRGGKTKRPVSDTLQPDTAGATTGTITPAEPTAQELWSEWSQVQSQPALSSAAGVTSSSVVGMSVAEMVSQQKKDKGGKRGRGKRAARGDETQRDTETSATEVTGMTNDGQDLTVTEMVMRARAEEARARKAEVQREKRKRASARKLAERQQAQSQVGGDDPVAPDIKVEEDQNKAGNNFRAGPGFDEGFRLLGGTSETPRGSSRGTTTDSGVLLPDRPVNRQTKPRGSKKQASRGLSSDAASQAGIGPGGSSSASFTRPNTSTDADPLYSGYLVVDPSDGSGSTSDFKTFSNTENESVAPHHSVSRRGSIGRDVVAGQHGSTSAVIIGLENLSLDKAPVESVKPSRQQAKPKPRPHTQTTPARTVSHPTLPIHTEPSTRTGRSKDHDHNHGDDDHDAHSITSYEEAHSSVRAYLANDPEFLADEKNKLHFWQALCVELGVALPPPASDQASNTDSLAETSDEEHIHYDPPSRRRSGSIVEATSTSDSSSTASDRTALADDPSRCSTPRPHLLPVPTTRTGCLRILKMNAHINLRDWFDSRPEVEQRLANLRHRIDNEGYMPDEEDMEYVYEPLRRLMFPSSSAMIRYTQKSRKIVGKKALKAEWLQPLMRDMHFGGARRE